MVGLRRPAPRAFVSRLFLGGTKDLAASRGIEVRVFHLLAGLQVAAAETASESGGHDCVVPLRGVRRGWRDELAATRDALALLASRALRSSGQAEARLRTSATWELKTPTS